MSKLYEALLDLEQDIMDEMDDLDSPSDYYLELTARLREVRDIQDSVWQQDLAMERRKTAIDSIV
jgi:hypothetical protein